MKIFFHALGKQTDVETLLAELKNAITALNASQNSESLEKASSAKEEEARESQGRSIDYETEIRMLNERKSSVQLELKEAERVQREVAMLRDRNAMLRARLELLREKKRDATGQQCC
jgi:Fe2+ transport system protein B